MSEPIVIRPPGAGSDRLVLEAPPSKSIMLRALAAAALAGGGSIRYGGVLPDDVTDFVQALRALGHPITEGRGLLQVLGPAREPAGDETVTIHVGEGAAPARFLLALAARRAHRTRVLGRPRLEERPMGPLLEALVRLGVRVEGGPGLPVTVQGPMTRGGSIAVESGRSSQFLSALLLALPGCDHAVHLRAEGKPVSRPYLDLTRQTMAGFGVEICSDLRVEKEARFRPADIRVEADWSGATVLLAAAAVLQVPVRVPGLRMDSRQPDAGFVEDARRLGLRVEPEGDGVVASGTAGSGGVLDAAHRPDAVPALAVLGALSGAGLSIRGAAHLRLKESDRIRTLVEILAAAGARAEALGDGLRVQGPIPRAPGSASPLPLHVRGDHRMAMAAALIGLRRPVLIDDRRCVAKSFPGFFEQWPGSE